MTFAPGTDVLVQEVWNGKVWAARPMRVDDDDGELAILWAPRGTPIKQPRTPPTREREPTRGERSATSLLLGDWVMADAEWHTDTLQFWRAGEWQSMWVSWLPSGEHWGWYVNLQLPYERFALGFRTMDLALDVIVDPDGTTHMKDEDELAIFTERGLVDGELLARIRAAAEFDRDRAPFTGGWVDWRPDPSWPLPELPQGWDECR